MVAEVSITVTEDMEAVVEVAVEAGGCRELAGVVAEVEEEGEEGEGEATRVEVTAGGEGEVSDTE